MPDVSFESDANVARIRAKRPRFVWGLFVVWLAYSGMALGWHIASNPKLPFSVCKVK